MSESERKAIVTRHASKAMEHIEKVLRGLRFGEVTVVVHDGFIVQVARTEKVRFEPGTAKS